jgi:hypothetical protein
VIGWLHKIALGSLSMMGGLLWWVNQDRKRQQAEVVRQRNRADTVEAVRVVERKVAVVQAVAREESKEAEHVEAVQRARRDRSGGLSNDRLRDD